MRLFVRCDCVGCDFFCIPSSCNAKIKLRPLLSGRTVRATIVIIAIMLPAGCSKRSDEAATQGAPASTPAPLVADGSDQPTAVEPSNLQTDEARVADAATVPAD